jgi:hypothetical protein
MHAMMVNHAGRMVENEFLFKGFGDTIFDEAVYSKGRMMRCAGNSKYGAAGTPLVPITMDGGYVLPELCPPVIMSNQYTISSTSSFGVMENGNYQMGSFMINEVTFNATFRLSRLDPSPCYPNPLSLIQNA